MTLGWGAACVDGIVILSDSMGIRVAWDDAGAVDAIAPGRDPEKLGWLGERVAYVISGSFDQKMRFACGEPLPALEDLARVIYEELLEHRVVTPRVRREPGAVTTSELQSVHVLIAGGPDGAPPALLRLGGRDQDNAELDVVPVGSTAWVGGKSDQNADVRHLRHDLTTDVALGIGIATIREYIRAFYRRFGGERLGDFPGSLLQLHDQVIVPFAFPLSVAVMTATEVRRYWVSIPDDVSSDDVQAARAMHAEQLTGETLALAAGVGPGS